MEINGTTVFNIAYIMTKNEPMDYDQRVLITTRTMDNLKKKELVNSEETIHKANEYISSILIGCCAGTDWSVIGAENNFR